MSNFLKKIRTEKGLTLEELARKIGTTKATISRLETGQRQLTTKWISDLAEGLGVPEYVILTGRMSAEGAATSRVTKVSKVPVDLDRWTKAIHAMESDGTVPVMPESPYGSVLHIAFPVGDAPGVEGFVEGYVIAIPYEEARPSPRHGDIVVAEERRKTDDGTEIRKFLAKVSVSDLSDKVLLETEELDYGLDKSTRIDGLVLSHYRKIGN